MWRFLATAGGPGTSVAPSPREYHIRRHAGCTHHSTLSTPSHESCGREAASAIASRRAVASTAVCGVSACPEDESELLGGQTVL